MPRFREIIARAPSSQPPSSRAGGRVGQAYGGEANREPASEPRAVAPHFPFWTRPVARELQVEWRRCHAFTSCLRASGWIGVLGKMVLSLFPAVPGDGRPHTSLPGQVEHFIAYALTATSFGLGYRAAPTRVALLGGLLGLAGVVETVQLWVPGRAARLIDFMASSGGGMTGMALGILIGLIIARA